MRSRPRSSATVTAANGPAVTTWTIPLGTSNVADGGSPRRPMRTCVVIAPSAPTSRTVAAQAKERSGSGTVPGARLAAAGDGRVGRDGEEPDGLTGDDLVAHPTTTATTIA